MDPLEVLKAILKTRVPVGMLVAICAVSYLPHAITAMVTHVGLPSLTTVLTTAVWPALAAAVLALMHRHLPAVMLYALRVLNTWRRRWSMTLVLVVVGLGSVVAMIVWPQAMAVRIAVGIWLLCALLAVAAATLLGAQLSRSTAVGAELTTPAERARSATNVLIGSLVVLSFGLIYQVVARRPLGAGSFREKCV